MQEKKYLSVTKRKFDPITVFISIALLIAVLLTAMGYGTSTTTDNYMFSDFRSFFFVVGGTLGVLLFQFDFQTLIQTLFLTVKSFFINPTKELNGMIEELDEAIITGSSILGLREGNEINGELLNDIVHMANDKLFYEEIEDFVTNRVASVFLIRKVAVSLLSKGAKIAPALGLLGTVIGLIEVLRTLEDPTNIGPAMSLALMTTAFGSILGSLIFTPLSGRLEHHNHLFLETHKLLMSRVSVLLQRENRRLNPVLVNNKLDD
ncbi:MAG: MotA/TolQ/ExbB proton channel family protein [Gammaproteobacteria bacterium]|nr:MotA/TolQ/ExbB proton channel family protein [Gammaproteobacteria bacterium]